MLPFANASGSADLDYLCDGLAEGLINSLSRNSDLKVIARLSSFRFRDEGADLQEVGKALGVETVVVGRLSTSGDEVSVSAELVDIRDRRQLWGARFSQADQDIVALETELAQAISTRLRPRADLEAQTARSHLPTRDSEAYRLYLQARELIVGSRTEMVRGIELLERAIARQPDYALAYCALSEAHLKMSTHRVEDVDEALEAARSALAEALRIDPDLAEAHSLMGSIAFNFDWNWSASARHHRRAMELDPGSLNVNLRYSEYLTQLGRWREAIEVAREAKKIDPLSTRATHWVGFALLGDRQFELAADEFQSAIDLNPHYTWGYLKLSKSLAHAGRLDEALAAATTADRMFAGDESPLARAWIGGTYFLAGADSLAQESFDQLLALPDGEASLCELYLTMGRVEEAMDVLERAVERHEEDATWLLALPGLFMPELAEVPRFQRLVRLMGLETQS